MADETLTPEQIAAALREISDQSVRRFEDSITKAKEIVELYKSRADAEKNLSEIIAKNNEIARAEAQKAAALLRENQIRRLKFADEEAAKRKEIASAEDDVASSTRRQNDLLEEQMVLQTKIRAEVNRVGTKNYDLIEQLKEKVAITKDQRAQAIAAADLHAERVATGKQDLKIRIERNGLDAQEYEHLVRNRKKKTEISSANEGIQASTRGFLKTFTGVTDQSDSFAMNLLKSDNAVGQIGDTMKATLTGPNMAFAALSKVFQSTLLFMKEFDKLAADFRKNTGIIDRGFDGIEQRIVNVQRANIRMGVSMNEAFQAAGSLTSEMASFTGMTDKSQASVLQAATVLQEFGVGAQTTAQIFNNFSKGLGYNANQLEKLSTQLMGISTSLKIPPQIIATEFNAASKELMKYGGDMVNVFKGIAEQSKQTGIAMGELLGIVKQFDTFEGAGAAVGKLNAILGGPYLNSINMLYATEEDRVKMLRESVALSGKQFNELSRFEKQAIAAAAGITDMAVAGNLFGGTSSEFAKTQMSMKEMQERAAKAQSVTEKFTQVMQSFAIALGPVVHLLGAVADALIIVMNPFGELARLIGFEDTGLISGLGMLTVGFYAYVAVMKLELFPLLTKKIIPALIKQIGLLSTTQTLVAGIFVGFMAFTALKGIFDDMNSGIATLSAGLVTLAVSFALIRAAMVAKLAGPMAFFVYPALAATALAGVYGALSSIPKFAKGKLAGQEVPGGAGLVGEKGSEMVVTKDGSRYMVDSPSVMALDKNDTVYSNAETKAMLSNGSSNDSGAAIAEMRQMIGELARSQQQQSAAADRRVEAMLDRPVVVAVNDKKLFETMKPQLNRALGLSRTGGVVG